MAEGNEPMPLEGRIYTETITKTTDANGFVYIGDVSSKRLINAYAKINNGGKDVYCMWYVYDNGSVYAIIQNPRNHNVWANTSVEIVAIWMR